MKRYFGFVIVFGFLLMAGISNGYALDCTGVGPECAWLAAHPTISNAIVWEDSIAGPLNYSAWSLSRKVALSTAFQTALNGGSYGLTDPPANILTLGDGDSPITVLAEGDAWSLYISYVANSIALEIDHRVSWSLLDYSDQDLAIFLDSREMFSWNATYQGYKIYYGSVPAPPDFTYSFLENNVTIAPNRLTTIAGLLDWSRNHLLHYSGNYQAANMEHYWQYRGSPPVFRVISTHWTAGCGGTTSFLRDVLRAANIPVVGEACGYHSCPHFPSEGMYLSHGDDPYDSLSKSTPPSPSVELLIDQTTWDAWFSPVMTYEQQNINVGRRSAELGIEYLANYLLGHYCDDLSKGLSHADGSVYYSLETLYSLADLEAQNLWGRMDAKMIPTSTTITPLSGQVGSYVYVNGTNFCKDQCRTSNPTETTVSLNGMDITPLWVDKTFLYFQVPAGATTGNITITTPVWDPSDNWCRSHVVSTQVFNVRDAGNCLNKNCDDGNMCTIDSCDPATGNCTHTPNTWICDDENVCANDFCDPATGNCSHTPVQNGTPCDDGNACTTGDVCSNGVCAGTPKNCDDGNFCTADICHADTGMCTHSNNTLSCNNGNTCTRDVCSGGVCVGMPKNCADGNVCTTDTCDAATDNCVHTNKTFPVTAVSPLGGTFNTVQTVTITCSDCTGSGCDKIYYTTNGATPTTTSSVYSAPISITATTTLKYFATDLAGNSEAVNTKSYIIKYPITTASPLGGTYSTAQTVTLTCSDGTGPGCNKIYYTTDGTTPTIASSVYATPISITAITTLKYFATDLDGNSEEVKTQSYIINRAPTLGTLTPSVIATAAGEPQTFTAIYSDPDGYEDLNAVCFLVNTTTSGADSIWVIYFRTFVQTNNVLCLVSDGGSLIADCCTLGSQRTLSNTQGTLNCAATTVFGSGNDLTVNWSITPKAAFASTTVKNLYLYAADMSNNIGVGWSDKGDWTIQSVDLCADAAARCNDNNACTTDTCNPATGACVYTPVANGTSCSDGNLCNGTETCQGGICTAGTPLICNDNNICTTDTCNPATGCVYTPVVNGTSCADNNLCNGTETCQGGICKAGTPLVCNDNNICTTDTCNPATGCVYTPVANGTSCLDGNLCNGMETCQGGICKAGTPLVCNDNNLCTIDTCNPATGCVYTPKCDDNNVCTTDICNTRTGACSHTNNTLSCNDNNACTTNDKCSGGVCKGTAKNCSDNNACTTDTCDTASGVCGHTPIVCNDNKSCTTDTCNPASGCVYTAVANGTVCTEVANGRCQTGTCVNIDLIPTAMTVTKSGTTGVVVNDTVKNQGTSNAGSFTITYYLSTNTTYESGTDIVLASSSKGTGTCSRTVTSLAAGASSSVTNTTCYKPSGAVTGVKYYVLVRDDSGNTVSEYNENNNVMATNGTISW